MSGAECTQVLSLGSIVGGRTPANRRWSDEIARLTKEVISACIGVVAIVNFNVTHVSGNITQPEFEGVRTGTYRESDSLLMVQVALAENAPDDPREYLLASLTQAVEAAERWADGRRIRFEAQPLLQIIEKVGRS